MTSLNLVEIQDSENHELIKEFVSLRKLFREKEFYVGGPSDEQVMALIPWGLARNAKFWMIKSSEGKPIARLCARVSPQFEKHGTVGLFEIDLKSPSKTEAFELIMEKALEWLNSCGVKDVVGPVDMSTWFTYRFSVLDKKFWPRYSWEPTTPPDYLEFFKQLGFIDHAYYHTIYFPFFKIGRFALGTGPMKRSYQSIYDQGFKLRPFDKENFLTHELPLFHDISHEAFQGSFMFEPIDLHTFSAIYASALKSYDFSPSSVLISPQGEVCGFIFAFYDNDCVVIKSLAIRKKYQGMNLSSGMIYNAVNNPRKIRGVFSALVKSGLASESIEKNVKKTHWFTWSHKYLLLKKEL